MFAGTPTASSTLISLVVETVVNTPPEAAFGSTLAAATSAGASMSEYPSQARHPSGRAGPGGAAGPLGSFAHVVRPSPPPTPASSLGRIAGAACQKLDVGSRAQLAAVLEKAPWHLP